MKYKKIELNMLKAQWLINKMCVNKNKDNVDEIVDTLKVLLKELK